LRSTIEACVAVFLALGIALTAQAGARLDYTLNCMGCHRAGGEGAPPDVPRLRDRVGYYLEIPGGREYLVQVPGARQAPLDDAELAAVLNFILDEFAGGSMPAGANHYAAEEVAALRASAPTDIDAVRRRLEAELERRHGAAY